MGSIIVELWAFMRERKKFWLLPILIMMVIFGGAMGAMIIGNSMETLKGLPSNMKKVFSGPKWKE